MASGTGVDAVLPIAEDALLALILAELVRTIAATLGGKPLTPEPFLVIVVVAFLRKLLLSTALVMKASAGTELVSPELVEVLVLGLLLLVLTAMLALLGRRRKDGPVEPL